MRWERTSSPNVFLANLGHKTTLVWNTTQLIFMLSLMGYVVFYDTVYASSMDKFLNKYHLRGLL